MIKQECSNRCSNLEHRGQQECSGGCSNLEHSDQTGGQWLMYLSGTMESIRNAVVDVIIWNTEVKQECRGGCFTLEHSGQTGGQWWMF